MGQHRNTRGDERRRTDGRWLGLEPRSVHGIREGRQRTPPDRQVHQRQLWPMPRHRAHERRPNRWTDTAQRLGDLHHRSGLLRPAPLDIGPESPRQGRPESGLGHPRRTRPGLHQLPLIDQQQRPGCRGCREQADTSALRPATTESRRIPQSADPRTRERRHRSGYGRSRVRRHDANVQRLPRPLRVPRMAALSGPPHAGGGV